MISCGRISGQMAGKSRITEKANMALLLKYWSEFLV
jgi:hypothetical protein